MTTEKIKLFSDSDLDGVSCGIVASIVFGENVDITYCSVKEIDKMLTDFIKTKEYENYQKIFITDLVLRESTGTLINSVNGFKFNLFDHHRSNYVNNKYTWAHVYESINNKKTCGTELFWNHLKEFYITKSVNLNLSLVDHYVECVRLVDTWTWVESGDLGIFAKNIGTIFGIYSKTKFSNNIMHRISQGEPLISLTEMEIIKAEELRKNRYIKQKMRNIRILNISGYQIGYVFAENYISELGNYIVKNVKDIKYAAIINVDTGVVSLRAAKDADVDLSEIAKSFSPRGGGHPFSAGFMFEPKFSSYFVENIFGLNKVECADK